jgi:hypothetical protein
MPENFNVPISNIRVKYSGYVGGGRDRDTYHYTLKTKGTVQIEFQGLSGSWEWPIDIRSLVNGVVYTERFKESAGAQTFSASSANEYQTASYNVWFSVNYAPTIIKSSYSEPIKLFRHQTTLLSAYHNDIVDFIDPTNRFDVKNLYPSFAEMTRGGSASASFSNLTYSQFMETKIEATGKPGTRFSISAQGKPNGLVVRDSQPSSHNRSDDKWQRAHQD